MQDDLHKIVFFLSPHRLPSLFPQKFAVFSQRLSQFPEENGSHWRKWGLRGQGRDGKIDLLHPEGAAENL
jgi:hypothetical protein